MTPQIVRRLSEVIGVAPGEMRDAGGGRRATATQGRARDRGRGHEVDEDGRILRGRLTAAEVVHPPIRRRRLEVRLRFDKIYERIGRIVVKQR